MKCLKTILAGMLSFVALVTSAGTVKITDIGAVFETGDYGVRLSKDISWTIREITFKDKTLMRDCLGAFNGTVLKTRGKESGKDDWVGTGHGCEVVESVTLFIDEKEQEIKDGVVYSGSEFRFVKSSDLRVLKLEATIIINDSGILERHRYAVSGTKVNISVFYIFMHSFDASMKEWLVKTSEDKLVSGNFTGSARHSFDGDIQWASLYSPVAKAGVAYVLKPAPGKAFHFFWDRAHDRKLYFCGPSENIRKMNEGDSFEYTVKLVGFEALEDVWKEKAAKLTEMEKEGF